MLRFAASALLVSLALLHGAPQAHGGDEMEGPEAAPGGGMAMPVDVPRGYGDLTRATIVASDGLPGALLEHLPTRQVTTPIPWPLPSGPLLVLGMPDRDPAAATLAQALGLIESPDDLAGGYGIWAWEDNNGDTRCVILGADPAALFAARFEMVADAPREMLDPSMRGVDTRGAEDGRAATLTVLGTRRVIPRARVRGVATNERLGLADIIRLAGLHINRVWLDGAVLKKPSAGRLMRQFARFGIEPVAVVPAPPLGGAKASLRAPLGVIQELQAQNVRHFALRLPPLYPHGRGTMLPEAWSVEAVEVIREALAASPPESLVLSLHGGQWPMRRAEVAAVASLPYARIGAVAFDGSEGASPDEALSTLIAQVPTCVMDRWAAPFEGVTTYAPSLPPAALLDAMEGADEVVVVGAQGTDDALARLWNEAPPMTSGPQAMRNDVGWPLAARSDAAWSVVPEALAAFATKRPGAPWIRALADFAKHTAKTTPASDRATVPMVAADTRIDGHLTDPAWAHARFVPFDPTFQPTPPSSKPLGALYFADGAHLYVGLRLPVKGTIEFAIHDGERVTARITLPCAKDAGELWTPIDGRRIPITIRGPQRARTAEFRLGRLALGTGDAHPGRIVQVRIGHDAATPTPNHTPSVWPPATEEGPGLGALLLLP